MLLEVLLRGQARQSEQQNPEEEEEGERVLPLLLGNAFKLVGDGGHLANGRRGGVASWNAHIDK